MNRLTYILLLIALFGLNNCGKKCDCSGERSKSVEFTDSEINYFQNISDNSLVFFRNNLNEIDSFMYNNYPIGKIKKYCSSPSLGCCICPNDHKVYKEISFLRQNNNVEEFKFTFIKDKDNFQKGFSLNNSTIFDDGNIFNTYINIEIDSVIYNDVYVIIADTNSNSIQYTDIWKLYFSKSQGLIKYDCLNNMTWEKIN